MIFAAGLGTRLRPITDRCPKALVEVHGIPMLDRVADNLMSHGFDRIVVNVHHHADMVIEHIGKHACYGKEIIVSDERDLLLDTCGGIRKAIEYIDPRKPLLVHNADILTDINLSDVYDSLGGADASLLCNDERKTSRHLLFDSRNRLQGWLNDKNGATRPEGIMADAYRKSAFGGIHVIGPRLLSAIRDKVSPNLPSPIIPFYIDMCGQFNIASFVPRYQYQWYDIGDISKLEQARSYYNEQK